MGRASAVQKEGAQSSSGFEPCYGCGHTFRANTMVVFDGHKFHSQDCCDDWKRKGAKH